MAEHNHIINKLLGKHADAKKLSSQSYHEGFKQSGIDKAQVIIQDLNRRDLHLEKFAYFSVGGSTGSEIIHVLENTEISYGLLLEGDADATDIAKSEFQQSRISGQKHLRIIPGDAMQRITQCKDELLDWELKGNINGLICSIQAVLHELPTRSLGFNLGHFLGEIIWEWDPFFLYCREPCFPDGWPPHVQLSIPGVSSQKLEVLANDIKFRLKFEGGVLRIGPEFVELPSELAVELLHKYYYIEDYLHEIEEKLTTFRSYDMVRIIESILGPNTVSQKKLNSSSFESLYKQHGIVARTKEGMSLPMPLTFLWLSAERNSMASHKSKEDSKGDGSPGGNGVSRKYLDYQREYVLNTPILPWSPERSPSLRFLWPKLFIEPRFRSHKHPIEEIKLFEWLEEFDWQGNIAVIGAPGIGKSTALNSLFLHLSENRESGGYPYPVIGHASEYIEHVVDSSRQTILTKAILEARKLGKAIVYFVDGLDELNYDLIEILFKKFLNILAPREYFWASL